MRVAKNDSDDRAGLRGYVQFNKYTYIHTCIHTCRRCIDNLDLCPDAILDLPPRSSKLESSDPIFEGRPADHQLN